ncbi:MAG: TlpA family protein disulfide reductase [Betaproteobacteria bacterium]|nr:TlpA family protein disulfide reductase [Betaproteobacteria bacterium]
MMHKLLGVWLIGFASLLSGPALASEEPTKAINFEFTDVEGKSFQLSDFKGRWVLVNFWAPWCPLCWVEVPTLNELNKRKDFVVIGVGLDYGPDANVVKETAKRHNIDFHAIVAGGARRNPDSPFRQVGPVDFYPTSYVYDPDGEIVMFIPGQVRMNRILAFMDDYRNKQTKLAGGKAEPRQGPSPIQEVSHSKPQSKTAAPRSDKPAAKPQAPAGKPRTVTY